MGKVPEEKEMTEESFYGESKYIVWDTGGKELVECILKIKAKKGDEGK